jgi:hypothetical protein
MEVCLEGKGPTSFQVESNVEHEKAPKVETAVENFGALKKQHGDHHLALAHCEEQKDRT